MSRHSYVVQLHVYTCSIRFPENRSHFSLKVDNNSLLGGEKTKTNFLFEAFILNQKPKSAAKAIYVFVMILKGS